MPIRVTCPSCGRSGQVPEIAMGRTVRCPVCSHSYVMTDDAVVLLTDDPQGQEAPVPVARMHVPEDSSMKAASNDFKGSGDRSGTRASRFPVSLALGGACVVVILSIGAVVALIRGRSSTGDAPGTVAEAPQKPALPEAPPAPSPAIADAARAALETVSADAPFAALKPPLPSADAVGPRADSDAAASEPADVAAQAGAAAVASRDDAPAGKARSTADIVAESEPSVALIKGDNSSGTGFLVGPGLVATNAHVIEEELVSELEVRFVSADDPHKKPLKAELLYEDRERDLAFLRVSTDLKPLRVAKTYSFRKGEDVTVIGNPGIGDGQVLENAISRGVMSTKTKIENRNFYQLGIAINPGNSGGPVFDSSGRVIGVATLKATKQEATGFSIPIEDVQEALAKLAKQSPAETARYRSQHRVRAAAQGLGMGGALLCIIIDLRRVTDHPEAREVLAKLEPVAAEMDKSTFSALVAQGARVKDDPLLASKVKGTVGDMAENFTRIRDTYLRRRPLDDNLLRQWKQAHKRFITELAAALSLEVPEGMMVAFDDHAPSGGQSIITIGPGMSGFGSFGPRFRQPSILGPPGMPRGIMPRQPSLRDRMRPRGIR